MQHCRPCRIAGCWLLPLLLPPARHRMPAAAGAAGVHCCRCIAVAAAAAPAPALLAPAGRKAASERPPQCPAAMGWLVACRQQLLHRSALPSPPLPAPPQSCLPAQRPHSLSSAQHLPSRAPPPGPGAASCSGLPALPLRWLPPPSPPERRGSRGIGHASATVKAPFFTHSSDHPLTDSAGGMPQMTSDSEVKRDILSGWRDGSKPEL